MRAHRDIDIWHPFRPSFHQFSLIFGPPVAFVSPNNFILAIFDSHRKCRGIVLELESAMLDDIVRQGVEWQHVVQGLIKFIDQNDIIGSSESEPGRVWVM